MKSTKQLLTILGTLALVSVTFILISSSADLPASNLIKKHLRKSHKATKKSHLDEQDLTHFCPNQTFRDDDSFNALMDNMQDQMMTDDKVEVLKEDLKQNPLMFSQTQIIQILNELPFTSSKVKAIKKMRNFVPYLSPEEMLQILDSINFTNDKLKVLKYIAPFLLNASDEKKEEIIESFTFSSSMEKAREILDKVVERNCLFGTVDEKVAVFVIDISGSMQSSFTSYIGSITRFQYVKANLKKTIATQLKEYQKFNIIKFSTYAYSWQNQPVDATPENIQAALSYIDNIYVGGSTNISRALNLAFSSSPDLKAVYLLSDGVPNYGVSSIDGMIDFVNEQEDSVGNDVKINTISFCLGGNESDSTKEKSKQFLQAIAETSHMGSFRQMAQE